MLVGHILVDPFGSGTKLPNIKLMNLLTEWYTITQHKNVALINWTKNKIYIRIIDKQIIPIQKPLSMYSLVTRL